MTDQKLYGICLACGFSHEATSRRKLLRPMVDLEVREIRAAWPCFYPATDTGDRRMMRDKAAVRRSVGANRGATLQTGGPILGNGELGAGGGAANVTG